MRAREHGFERGTDARLETALLGAGAEERHQRGHVLVDQRPPERLPSQPGDDLGRAGGLFRRVRGPAGEDGPAAGGLRHPGGVEGAADDQVAQVGQRQQAVGAGDGGARERPVVRGDEVLNRAFRVLQEGRGHPVVAGAHENRFGAHLDAVRIGDVHPAVEFEDRHPFAVDGDLELLRGLVGVQSVAPVADQGAGGFVVERDPEDVFTVGREVVLDAEAAARSIGGAFDPLGLRSPAGDLVLGLARSGGRVAQRQPRDVARPVQVGFQQGGREHLCVGDVVEVRALGIEREILAGVYVEIEQVLDRAFVLGAVQALEGTGPGIGVGREGGVHAILERGDQQLQRVADRAGHPRWGHHPRAQLEDHLLHGLGARGQVVDVEAGEGEVAGEERVVVADLAVALNDVGEVGGGQMSGNGRVRGRSWREGFAGRS